MNNKGFIKIHITFSVFFVISIIISLFYIQILNKSKTIDSIYKDFDLFLDKKNMEESLYSIYYNIYINNNLKFIDFIEPDITVNTVKNETQMIDDSFINNEYSFYCTKEFIITNNNEEPNNIIIYINNEIVFNDFIKKYTTIKFKTNDYNNKIKIVKNNNSYLNVNYENIIYREFIVNKNNIYLNFILTKENDIYYLSIKK